MINKQCVYIISDSVGETAELVIKAGLSQFGDGESQIQRVPYVEDKGTIKDVLLLAQEKNALVGFTLVNPVLRNYLHKTAEILSVKVIDIMGPMMRTMESMFKEDPHLEPGLVHKLDEDYFKKVEAIEFAVKYDDGRDPRGISRADIVLIGVSRTSKTPLSQYLALKRLKVANVPIVPEVEPPEELYAVDPSKCVGLRIDPDQLNHIRRERLKALGLGDQAIYANMKRIHEELDYFDKIINRIGCTVVDVSNKAVEETANIILHSIQEHNI